MEKPDKAVTLYKVKAGVPCGNIREVAHVYFVVISYGLDKLGDQKIVFRSVVC